MSEFSIADAKNNLPRLVQRAEAGEVVRITRRGRQVAVLLSEQRFEDLTAPRPDLAAFLSGWRAEMEAGEIAFADDADFEGLRDHGERPPVAWE